MIKPQLKIDTSTLIQQRRSDIEGRLVTQEITEETASATGAHASDHITGGSDQIDGDKLDIDWNPSNYTPSTSPSEADNVDNLTAHLYGIDQKLAGKLERDGSVALTADWDIGDGLHIKADEIRARDGDGLKLSDGDGDPQIFVDTDTVTMDTNSLTISGTSTTTVPLDVRSTSTLDSATWLAEFHDGSVKILEIRNADNPNAISIKARDMGSGSGPRFNVERNNNSSTPAAGHLALQDKGGAYYRVWPDDSGNLRIWTSDPTNANDTSGTVVGSQTSFAAAKHISDELPDAKVALQSIVNAAHCAVRKFSYKDGSYNQQVFETGLVIDHAPRYGMDLGRSLNVATAIGDLFLAVKELSSKIENIERRLN